MDTFTPQCSTCWLPACNRGCDNEAKDPGACEVTSMAVQPQPVERPWVRFYDDGVPAHLTYPEILLHHILEESARKYARLTALTLFGRQIEHQLKDAGVEVAVTLSQFFPRVAAAAGRTGVRHVVFTGINEYMPPHLRLLYPIKAKREGQWVRVTPGRGVLPFSALLADAPPQPVAVSPDDPALYQYTGGTTGVPKAAVLTHRNLVYNTLQAAAWFPGSGHAGERAMAVLPFFHIYGMTSVLNFSLRLGMAIILVPRFDPEMVLHAVHRHRPTVFHGVPTMYSTLLNHAKLAHTDMRSIQTCISGAMGLPQEVKRRWEAVTGGRLVGGYGLSEAAPITHCPPVAGYRKSGSIGVPFPDTDARIADAETGRTLPVGEVGELAVRGPQVMRGYLNRPEETAGVLRDGWLFTGDIARPDPDGLFFLVDRKKEMINCGDLVAFPREVEEVLYEHPAVREAAAIPAPDPMKGEVVKAYVALREGAAASPEELIAFCRQRLAPHKVPKAVEFRDTLPKTLIGKILRRALVEEDRRSVT